MTVSDSDHFAAFSFVDRITERVPGKRARGTFAIPADIDGFPPCLMAEAVGQLAAWVAMSHIEFRGRPVAALASETRFLRAAQPGDVLDLDVEIHDVDDDAVAYHGHADIGGERAIELVDCLGPMLPLAEFDDPRAMAERFALLVDGGAAPFRFHGVQRPPIVREGNTARLDVPQRAAFFNDHFPRRNVFPATLMLDAQIELALAVARESWRDAAPVRMTHVKVRSFTSPGALLTLVADLREQGEREATFNLSARADGKPVATARVVIAEMSPHARSTTSLAAPQGGAVSPSERPFGADALQ
jgi:3-hydroxymyristoyl/3-hydroxydecanoyl-(acyl carrier protein) dehydratase